MPLIIIAAGVALLLILMIGFKVNGFIALVLVAAVVGFAEGMDAQAVLHSIQNGIGSTLGGLAMILGFGAMLGKLISDTGAAQRIATTLIATFGKKRVQWALVITGLVVGLAMFFQSGLCPAVAVGIYHRGIIWITPVVCWRTDGRQRSREINPTVFCRHIQGLLPPSRLSLRLILERLYCMDLSLPFRQLLSQDRCFLNC